MSEKKQCSLSSLHFFSTRGIDHGSIIEGSDGMAKPRPLPKNGRWTLNSKLKGREPGMPRFDYASVPLTYSVEESRTLARGETSRDKLFATCSLCSAWVS
jgi:hypothetical protein